MQTDGFVRVKENRLSAFILNKKFRMLLLMRLDIIWLTKNHIQPKTAAAAAVFGFRSFEINVKT